MIIHPLPDVASNANAEIPSSLQWVGMEGVAVPMSMALQNGELQRITAKASMYVNLENPNAKGIHMSRLHSIVNQLAEFECNKVSIECLLNEMIASQGDISSEAKIKLEFDVLINKPALISNHQGYQSYPVTISAQKGSAQKNANDFLCEFEVTIPYSSTCPCSASLARQLYSKAVDQTFPDEKIDKAELLAWLQSETGSVATPHSQRSYAYIRFSIGANEWPNLPQLILQIEKAIGTPVQTAVKRSDEQEFARLNAANLMFCEDAARRIKSRLEKMAFIKKYWFKIEHQESLHAHNAVVIDQR